MILDATDMRYLYPIVVAIILVVAIYIIQTMIALPDPLGHALYVIMVLLIIAIIALIILQLYFIVAHKDTFY